MDAIKNAYYRSFQAVFNVAARCLYWRKPITVEGEGALSKAPELFKKNHVKKVMIVTGRTVGKTIAPIAKAALDKALTVIKANHGEDRVTVVGWTDSMGTDAYNLRLSLRRAEAVKAYLAEKGIALDKLASEGRGESFKYNNGTEEGRQQNRRVELHFEQ